jgi:two-component system heavy metal sensor histidine kinase CusS
MSRPLSISLRLGLLFAAIAAAVFMAVGAYLYQTLANQMGRRDDADLLNKAVLMRQLLGTLPERDRLPRQMETVLGRVIGQDGVTLQLATPDGTILSGPAQRIDGTLVPVPIDREPTMTDVVGREDADGAKRVLGVMASVGQASMRVTLARTRSDRLAILRRYAFDLLAALAVGTAVATALGFVAVRHGLRPVYKVATKARSINAQRLATRMPAEELPVELRPLAFAFNAMLDRLEEGVQRLSGFAADLAHDLRTPVNALMMQAQVALSRERTLEEYEALLASNVEEYERLSRMIENTLFLARADNAQLAVRHDVIDVRDELDHIREYFDMVAEEKAIRLVVDAMPRLSLHADPVLLRRAVSNLVSNAVKYAPHGGAVDLGAAKDDRWLTISVTNTGDGIDPDHVPHVFDRYYRGDAAREAGSSIGLGLSIVRAIMRLHDGDVEVDNVPGQRTMFRLRFPVRAGRERGDAPRVQV